MASSLRNIGRRLGVTAGYFLRFSRENEHLPCLMKHGWYVERQSKMTRRNGVSWPFLFNGGRAPFATEAKAGSTLKDEEHAHAEDADGTLSVDRSGLCPPRAHTHGPIATKEEETPLTGHLKTVIRFRGGPITVAEYMDEVLTNPKAGFYMNRDVFGTRGDFVTSPEISQMFGELVGVWAMCTWQQMGCPPKLQLIELGPGRGTLMADLLRGTAKFAPFASALSVHLVECSPALKEIQKKAIVSSVPVEWHLKLEDVPRGVPTIIIAHEFFDALPVHQFQRTQRGWCERLIDVDDDPDSPHHFRFVLSPNPTPAAGLFLTLRLGWEKDEVRGTQNVAEVSPASMKVTREIAKRVGEDGGAALLVDYGEDKLVADSLQAIREHKFVGLLDRPGTADLSVYVDFAAIRHMVKHAKAGAVAHGPISQSELLGKLGINARLESLLKSATEEQAQALWIGYWRLVGDGKMPTEERDDEAEGRQVSDAHEGETQPESVEMPPGMGQRYKAMAIVNEKLGSPICFEA